MINEKEVHFVDHSYKSQLEKWNELQVNATEILKQNHKMPSTIKDWKADIRDIVFQVRHQMNKFVDNFTMRFLN